MQTLFSAECYEAKAKKIMTNDVYDFYAGGSGTELALRRNTQVFDNLQIIPNYLCGIENCDLSVNLLDEKYSLPMLIAPMAFHKLAHQAGETATTLGASAKRVNSIVSTMSSVSLKELAALVLEKLWFQIYVMKDRSITKQIVQYAEAAGCGALVVTVDLPIMARRKRDHMNKFSLPNNIEAKNLQDLIGDEFTNQSLKNATDLYFKNNLSWQDIEWLASLTNLPIILKGILSPSDAKQAIDYGVQGLIVSNHGGRQLNSAVTPSEILPEIKETISDALCLILDSGIRSGEDIFKALALGADAILLGRPIIWGLAVNGQVGVEGIIQIFIDELIETMLLTGCRNIQEIKNIRLHIYK